MVEEFRSIKGYDGFYEVSNFGNVRSVNREVITDRGQRFVKGKILNQFLVDGIPKVGLSMDGKRKAFRVHNLVANAFIVGKGIVKHIDSDSLNNHVLNLRVISKRDKFTKRGKELPVGVTKTKTGQFKYQAHISAYGKQYCLGSFNSIESAHNAYEINRQMVDDYGLEVIKFGWEFRHMTNG